MRIIGLVVGSLSLIALLVVSGCAQSATPAESPEDIETEFALTSSAFEEGAEMPIKYTDDGQNVSPPLDWSRGPSGTTSFALIMDDLDAGNFTHWVIFNLPPDSRGLPEAVPRDGQLGRKALQGKNGG